MINATTHVLRIQSFLSEAIKRMPDSINKAFRNSVLMDAQASGRTGPVMNGDASSSDATESGVAMLQTPQIRERPDAQMYIECR